MLPKIIPPNHFLFITWITLLVSCSSPKETKLDPGLTIQKANTEWAYFAMNEQPILSFGGGPGDIMLWLNEDAFDYKKWCDWAQRHGMNHGRDYPPLNWKGIIKLTKENHGDTTRVLFPYEETSPGSRQFDLTKFNEKYWQRFREQIEHLQAKGIILHLIIWNGWQTNHHYPDHLSWKYHFFNPANNVNAITDSVDAKSFYYSVAEGNVELLELQKAWFLQVIRYTYDLDNVYYDLIHEMGDLIYKCGLDWEKSKPWVETMSQTVRNEYNRLSGRSCIMGIDGGISNSDPVNAPHPFTDWVYSQSYFDLCIWGKSHNASNILGLRRKYKKPYIGQESWDDNGQKYSLRNPERTISLRKYLWKSMLLKNQQIDVYHKHVDRQFPALEGLPFNYDPWQKTKIGGDALIMRQFWNSITDYPNLKVSHIKSTDSSHQIVLSSSKEYMLYQSSGTGQENIAFDSSTFQINTKDFETGDYRVDIIHPGVGKGRNTSRSITVKGQPFKVKLPAYVDDIVVHIYRDSTYQISQQISSRQVTQEPGYHWFGYYDKFQTSPNDRQLLTAAVKFEGRTPLPTDTLDIKVINLSNQQQEVIGTTSAWSWQQGCMLQWIPNSTSEVIWNVRAKNGYSAKVYHIETEESRLLPKAVYTLSNDGKEALCLDFARVQSIRPGYGYVGIQDTNFDELAPSNSGIWKMNLKTGKTDLIISINQIAKIPWPDLGDELIGAKHYFNHLSFSPSDKRILFFHRCRIKGTEPGDWSGIRTRMFTANADGSDIYLLDKYGKTSHFAWKNDTEILAFAYHPSYGRTYYLFEDKTSHAIPFLNNVMPLNGHQTYIKNGEFLLNDSNWKKPQPLFLVHVPTGRRYELGSYPAPTDTYFGEWRCDLHPRINRQHNQVIFDSPHQNGRQQYVISIDGLVN